MNKSFSNKYLFKLLTFLLLLFSATLYVSPYLSILSFKRSLDLANSNKAISYIDFPLVRRSLKSQLLRVAKYHGRQSLEGTSFADIKMMILNPILSSVVDTTVNSTVTPDGLRALLNKGKLSKLNSEDAKEVNSKLDGQGDPKIQLYYKGINNFVLSSKPQSVSQPVMAIWSRYGLFKWKLVSLELPLSTLEQIN